MEAIIVGALIIGAIIWFASSRRQQATIQRRTDLETWEMFDTSPGISIVWRAHFPTMQMTMTMTTDDPGSRHAPTQYLLARNDRGWRAKLTDECYRAKIEDERANIVEGGFGVSFAKERLADLELGNNWIELPADQYAGMETAYARYVAQG